MHELVALSNELFVPSQDSLRVCVHLCTYRQHWSPGNLNAQASVHTDSVESNLRSRVDICLGFFAHLNKQSRDVTGSLREKEQRPSIDRRRKTRVLAFGYLTINAEWNMQNTDRHFLFICRRFIWHFSCIPVWCGFHRSFFPQYPSLLRRFFFLLHLSHSLSLVASYWHRGKYDIKQ